MEGRQMWDPKPWKTIYTKAANHPQTSKASAPLPSSAVPPPAAGGCRQSTKPGREDTHFSRQCLWNTWQQLLSSQIWLSFLSRYRHTAQFRSWDPRSRCSIFSSVVRERLSLSILRLHEEDDDVDERQEEEEVCVKELVKRLSAKDKSHLVRANIKATLHSTN
ncbi:vacuolar protein sorting-associated protein [Striga asiatica]|uniref:Vacuolar protein sorting-associated protein n=1 Tax=Striga asiatica TaxID=4170 RepID=A0A5A7Q9L4_STRAF|nr:vacuolar protein sorting-associated protein [Striga asiatica]